MKFVCHRQRIGNFLPLTAQKEAYEKLGMKSLADYQATFSSAKHVCKSADTMLYCSAQLLAIDLLRFFFSSNSIFKLFFHAEVDDANTLTFSSVQSQFYANDRLHSSSMKMCATFFFSEDLKRDHAFLRIKFWLLTVTPLYQSRI